MYDHIRDTYIPQITEIHKEFENKPDFKNLTYQLGEIPQCAITAANTIVNTIVNTTHIYAYLFSLLYLNHLYIVTTLYIYVI